MFTNNKNSISVRYKCSLKHASLDSISTDLQKIIMDFLTGKDLNSLLAVNQTYNKIYIEHTKYQLLHLTWQLDEVTKYQKKIEIIIEDQISQLETQLAELNKSVTATARDWSGGTAFCTFMTCSTPAFYASLIIGSLQFCGSHWCHMPSCTTATLSSQFAANCCGIYPLATPCLVTYSIIGCGLAPVFLCGPASLGLHYHHEKNNILPVRRKLNATYNQLQFFKFETEALSRRLLSKKYSISTVPNRTKRAEILEEKPEKIEVKEEPDSLTLSGHKEKPEEMEMKKEPDSLAPSVNEEKSKKIEIEKMPVLLRPSDYEKKSEKKEVKEEPDSLGPSIYAVTFHY